MYIRVQEKQEDKLVFSIVVLAMLVVVEKDYLAVIYGNMEI